MNIRGVLKLMSPALVVIGAAMVVSAGVSVYYNETPFPLLIGGGSSILAGILFQLFTRKTLLQNLGIREGCAVVTFTWVLAALFGALPFYFMGNFHPGLETSFTKSYYEIMSGLTTTGSSIFSDVEILPKGILFWRSFSHWFGGMGIIVFAIAILPKLGFGGMQAMRMESAGPLKSDKLVPRIGETAKILYKVYLGVTIVMLLMLLIAGVGVFDSFIHTFGAVGTGGFSNYNRSVAGLNNIPAEYIIAFFMWLCGANFGLIYYAIAKRDIRTFWRDPEFKGYTAVTLIAIALIAIGLYANNFNNWSIPDVIRYATFQVPTIMTTTGYATYDFVQWPVFPVTVLVMLLFVGGSTGSTAGGLKILRHMINIKSMKQEILKIVKPNLVTTVKVGDRPIEARIVSSVMVLSLIYFLTFTIGGFALTAFGVDIVTAFSASIANLGNVGPGIGQVGPAGNYGFLHPTAIWVLSFLMLLGRLEIFTVFALFVPFVWKKRRVENE